MQRGSLAAETVLVPPLASLVVCAGVFGSSAAFERPLSASPHAARPVLAARAKQIRAQALLALTASSFGGGP
jgi:hypothetical protein